MDDRNFGRAMELAREYEDARHWGRTGEAEGLKSTIETLVGRYVDGRLTLPRDVAKAMRRPDLAENRRGGVAEVSRYPDPPSPKRHMVSPSAEARSRPVEDPFYVVQGMYGDGRIVVEFGYDDEEKAIYEAEKLLKIRRSHWFEGDRVRVITRDGELVWDSCRRRHIGGERRPSVHVHVREESCCACRDLRPSMSEARFPKIRRLPPEPIVTDTDRRRIRRPRG